MRIFLIVIFFFCKSILINAQQVTISGVEGNRNLVWADFTGTSQPDSSYSAYTHWNLMYKYKGIQVKGDSAKLDDLVVNLLFDTISWVKAGQGTDDLLQHEQGHFDIGRIAMKAILDSLQNKTFFKETLRIDVKDLFFNILTKYQAMGISYDAETKHGLKKSKQKEWNKYFKTHLEQGSIIEFIPCP